MKISISLLFLFAFQLIVFSQTLTDIEGNVYNTVVIGNQEWMTENLKTTQFNDGTLIPKVTDASEWISLTSAAYTWMHNDSLSYFNHPGGVYNWYTASMPNICPTGWVVPSVADRNELISHLGGANEETALAMADESYGGNNSSGLSLQATGIRFASNGSFIDPDGWGGWWLRDQTQGSNANLINHDGGSALYSGSYDKQGGMAIRCIRNDQHTGNTGNTTTQPLGIKVSSDQQVSAYPNPVKNTLYISGAPNASVFIYSLNGTVLLQTEIATNNIDVSQLPEGMYMLVIKTENSMCRKLLVK